MSENYLVYSVRQEQGKGALYFWSGECFTGDISQAKIHPQYADCIDTIWNGILWRETKKINDLGFKALRAIPLEVAKKDILPEWCGKEKIFL